MSRLPAKSKENNELYLALIYIKIYIYKHNNKYNIKKLYKLNNKYKYINGIKL